jgi:predicted hydrolase (HD superfamily)
MGWYARQSGEDEELWRAVGLLHDFDYEMHPTLDSTRRTARRSCARRATRRGRRGVLSHAEHLSIPRDTQLKKTLFACDELSGFVHAVALVRPTASTASSRSRSRRS